MKRNEGLLVCRIQVLSYYDELKPLKRNKPYSDDGYRVVTVICSYDVAKLWYVVKVMTISHYEEES